MANYKLITQTATGTTSQLMFTATATNTVVSSITAKDGNLQVAEVLIQKSGGSVIELAEVELTSNGGTQIIDVAFALEAGDKVFTRATRSGMKFIMSYVEETDVPNTTNLGGLGNVDTTGAADGQSLVYNSSSAQWEPVTVTGGTGGSGAADLDELDDVAITSAVAGHILRHNGSNFVNVTPTTAMITESTGAKYLDVTNEQKLNNITVTGAADLDDIATNSAKVSFPGFGTTAGTALEGDTALFSGAYADLTGKPTLFDGDYNSLSNQPSLFDGDYGNLTNVPSTFTPESHTHVASDITDFNSAVDARIPTIPVVEHDATQSLASNGDAADGAETINFDTTALTLALGRVYGVGTTGWEVVGNTDASMEKLFAVAKTTDGSEMVLKGVVKVDLTTASGDIGSPVYLGTGSKFTLTAPTSAAYVIKMGYVLGTGGKIFFNPDATSIKLQ